jgi:hypothetical protein
MISKPFKIVVAAITSLVVLTQVSCNSDDESGDCQNTVCTLELRRIIITITDQNQNPVALDSFEVINMENGKDIALSLSASELAAAQLLGEYPLIEDGMLSVNQERRLRFKGFINNREVINSNYSVSTDCCHVSLTSGNPQLNL